jgi:large subunit ribosomal protein L21
MRDKVKDEAPMATKNYAVIKTGGKQYRVTADDVFDIEKVSGEAGELITFDSVMMIGGDGKPTVGSPLIEGASVSAEIVDQRRDRKIIVFKKKRRKNYRRKNGHRQELTRIRILEVLAKGQKATIKTSGKSARQKGDDGALEPLFKTPDGDADDLKKISGVGPTLEKKLNDLGITTYKQVADLSKEEITKVDDALSFKGRIERDDWLSQAKALDSEKN